MIDVHRNAATRLQCARAMSSSPYVTVVMPVHNAECYLEEAAESILTQTFSALELLLIENGSTDSSATICERLAERDPRVRVLRLPQRGFTAALNAGLAATEAKYVARMDADDVSHRTRVALQVDYLDAHAECVAVGAAVEVIDEDLAPIAHRAYFETHDEIMTALINGHSSTLAHPVVMMRRDALVAAGGYDAAHWPSEDLALWFKLSELGKLANLPETLLKYRRHRATVGVMYHQQQMAMTERLVGQARARRDLPSLPPRLLAPGIGNEGRYHFECARLALFTGTRRAALRHAWACVAHEPRWPQAYGALFAVALPRTTLWLTLRVYGRVRAVLTAAKTVASDRLRSA